MNNLEIKPISDLLKQSFWIPSYQRGYRWTPQEVTDLLDDIHDFQSNSIAEETDLKAINEQVLYSIINRYFEEDNKDFSALCLTNSNQLRWSKYRQICL